MSSQLKDLSYHQLQIERESLEAEMDKCDDSGNYHGYQDAERRLRMVEEEIAARPEDEASD